MKKDKLKYSELLDYIMLVLQTDKNINGASYVSLVSILRDIQYQYSFGDVLDIGKYFETRGWAKASYPLGDVRLQITAVGLAYLEEKGDKWAESLIKNVSVLRGGKIPIERISSKGKNIDRRGDVFKLLEKIKAKIEGKLGGDNDTIKDIELVKLELTKIKPDIRMMETKLDFLSTISEISDDVQEMKSYLMVA